MKKRWILNLIDKSISMTPLTDDVIKGYNQFLSDIKNIQSEECRWTTILFNNSEEELNDDLVKNIEMINSSYYKPEKQTSLFDSIGNLCLKIISNSVDYDKIVVNIFTDGKDTSSIKYNHFVINDLLNLIKNKYQIDINFYCTTQEAFKEILKFKNINDIYLNKDFIACSRQMSRLSSDDINIHETPYKKFKKNN